MPNLEKLRIKNIISLDIKALNIIFENKPRLSHIHVDDIAINVTIDVQYVDALMQVAQSLDYIELNKILLEVDEDLIAQIMDNKFAYVNCKKWRNEIILRNCVWNTHDENVI
jgi:hypothetical protein